MSRASDDQWSRTSQIRILQIVENLDNRAVESWLFRIFLRASRQDPRYHWTFFCVLPEQGVYDEAVRQAGGEVIYSRYELGNKIAFTTSLRKVMREGQYDILHCHHDIMSAAYLLTSWGLPFRQRIIHLHNTALGLPTPSRFKQTLLSQPMRQVCLRLADQIVGISEDALSSIIGNEPRRRGRDSVVHYGIDTELFAPPIPDKVSFRQQLGFASETKILLFVGRMVDYKNPCFVVEVLEHLRKLDPDFVAVFAGTGPFEADVKQLAEKNSLKRHIKLLGFRNDVPQVMHAADVLIWPSLEDPKEGLGLGIVEAQAAGLPILMSRSVPDEAVVIPELVEVLPLAAGAQKWADAVWRISRRESLSKEEALARVEASSFSMSQGVSNIMALYRQIS